jgi:CRISPR-associated endonuclease/helicase Cas3
VRERTNGPESKLEERMKPEFVAHTPRKGTDEWHSLEAHVNGVINRATKYAGAFGGEVLTELAGLWHDLGKYNPAFQTYLEACHLASITGAPPPPKGVPHAIYGAMLAFDLGLEFLAPLIAGHHAGLYAPSELKKRLAELETRQTFESVCHEAQRAGVNLQAPANLEANFKFPEEPLEIEMLLRFVFSALVDADFLDTEQHFNEAQTAQREMGTTIENLQNLLEKHLDSVTADARPSDVNTVRAEVLKFCRKSASLEPGAFRLTVPTGGGKTLSGLAFALAHAHKYKLKRVIVAVPYTSIIEQTVHVYREIFGVKNVLEHHSATRDEAFDDSEDPTEAKTRAKLAAQNWDAPLIVTTTVQLFESLFGRYTSQCRKLHNLTCSVIVLDEVQTLPLGLLKPTVNALKTVTSPRYGSSVVLCTATQPALENSKFLDGFATGSVRNIIAPEAVQRHFDQLKRVRYAVNLSSRSWSDLAAEWRDHPQLLVVLNTRKDAMRALENLLLKQAQPSGHTLEQRIQDTFRSSSVLHLSTLLCGVHRRLALEEIRSRLQNGRPIQLISTQVIEAGVDVDFPVMYRALGPLDRIVQAAGRCNREGKLKELGQAFVFVPEGGGAPRGEYATALSEAKTMLEKGVQFDDPDLFQHYFQRLYQGVNLDQHEIQKLRERFDYPEVAKRYKLISDDTRPVIIEFDGTAQALTERIRKRGFALHDDYHTLQPYLVNLRTRDLEQHLGLTQEIAEGMRVWLGGYDALRGIQFGDWAAEDLVL